MARTKYFPSIYYDLAIANDDVIELNLSLKEATLIRRRWYGFRAHLEARVMKGESQLKGYLEGANRKSASVTPKDAKNPLGAQILSLHDWEHIELVARVKDQLSKQRGI